MKTYIKSISYYLPEKTLDNITINRDHPEWSIDKISAKTGIINRHIANTDEFASDMAIKAANKLFSEYNIDPKNIDFLLYCTQSPDYFLPTTACILQEKLGMPVDSGAMDFNLGCSGFVYGLSIAKGLILSGAAKNILLITSETYSKFIHSNDKSNKTIFGDAAAAALISDTGDYSIADFCFGTNGKGAENLIVKFGAIRYKNDVASDIFDSEGNFIKNDACLFMNGSEIFSFTSQAVPILVNETLAKNKLSLDDIDAFVFHQANKYMLDFIRKKINIPAEKFVTYIEQVGNTVSSTIPIALKECILNQNINKNKILLAGFGVGYSWAACVLEKNNGKIS